MAESTPPVPEEYRQLNRSLTEKVLDKAASDPEWKQRLLDDPAAALRVADFPESQRIEETRQSVLALQEEAEVSGQARPEFTNAYPCCFYTWWF